MKALNLGVRFLLELCMLAALGYGGYHLADSTLPSWLLAIGLPILAAVIWGQLIAPKAASRLRQPLRLIVELLLFFSAAAVLYVAGQPMLAGLFILFVSLNELLVFAWKQ